MKDSTEYFRKLPVPEVRDVFRSILSAVPEGTKGGTLLGASFMDILSDAYSGWTKGMSHEEFATFEREGFDFCRHHRAMPRLVRAGLVHSVECADGNVFYVRAQ